MFAPGQALAKGILLLLATTASVCATSVCLTPGSCNTNWQPLQNPADHPQGPDPDGPMYFDGYSWDFANANVTYFILGTGFYSNNPLSPNRPLPYWGNSDGSAVASFFFHSNSLPQAASLLSTEGLWAPYSSLGWYDPNSAAWGWIFQANGLPPAPRTVLFTPTVDYGLFFVPDSLTFDPSKSYYTDSTRNGIADEDVAYAATQGIILGPEAYQHFAVFRDDERVYVGVNDRSNQVGDHDYNDMIVRIGEASNVPEPGYLILLTMLSTVGVIVPRRRDWRCR